MRNGKDMTIPEVYDAIEHLRRVLEHKLQVTASSNDQYTPPTFQDKWDKRQQLLKKYVGKRVKITITGPYHGQDATVTGPRGKQMVPTYWYLLLANGKTIHKASTSFNICKTDET